MVVQIFPGAAAFVAEIFSRNPEIYFLYFPSKGSTEMRKTARTLAAHAVDDLLSIRIPLFSRSKCKEVFLGINAGSRTKPRCSEDEVIVGRA